MRTAARPFLFMGCVELRQTLDVHALDERELMHRLGEVPEDSVFFHTFGYFLRHRPFTTAYANDFARWAAVEIFDRTLAERLAVVDPFARRSPESTVAGPAQRTPVASPRETRQPGPPVPHT